MNYLTQHYKNRCEQLQEQISILSKHLTQLMEASTTASGGATETADASGYTPTYDGAGLAQLLGSVGSSMTPANQAALRAYLSAWNAQNMGGGGPQMAAPLMTQPSTGKSVANVARDIMAGGPGAPTSQGEEDATPTPSGGAGSAGGGGGGANIPGDYNGDGMVDGADLSIALGNFGREGYDVNKVLQNWTGRASGSEGIRGTINPRRRA